MSPPRSPCSAQPPRTPQHLYRAPWPPVRRGRWPRQCYFQHIRRGPEPPAQAAIVVWGELGSPATARSLRASRDFFFPVGPVPGWGGSWGAAGAVCCAPHSGLSHSVLVAPSRVAATLGPPPRSACSQKHDRGTTSSTFSNPQRGVLQEKASSGHRAERLGRGNLLFLHPRPHCTPGSEQPHSSLGS